MVPPVLLRAVRGGEYDRRISLVRVGDPRLRPVQHPLIAVETRRCYCGSYRQRGVQYSKARATQHRVGALNKGQFLGA